MAEDNGAYETIISKRDTRAFEPRLVPEETVRRIVQAGRMAGSSKNTQPCRFVIIDSTEQLAAIATCGDFAGWLPNAPLAVAVALTEEGTRQEFDAGRAAQNMMVAAWGEGVSSCPVSIHHVDCGREKLGLPEGWRVGVVVGFGYPSGERKVVAAAARKPWDEYVQRNRWS
jgi:nitroreductase